MVQYVLTPWRDRHELLLVRQQFYNDPAAAASGDNDDDDRRSRRLHQAVARVSMWMQRRNCPHMVESTALLTAAMLSDEEAGGGSHGHAASSAYATRAAYSAAFSRFVTGLLDGQQDKQRKQSMYSLAKTIDLPATFVELRHQATHEQLPSLAKLRSAARKALRWIWEYYWRHLGPEEEEQAGTCETAVLRYLAEEQDDERDPQELTGRWEREELLACLAGLQGRLPGSQAQIKCLRLSRELMKEQGQLDEAESEGAGSNEEDRIAGEAPELEPEDSAEDTGWSLYEGPWRPKPIGIV